MPDTSCAHAASRQRFARSANPRALRLAATVLVLLSAAACDSAGRPAPRSSTAPKAQTAAATAGSGATAHELYLARGIGCDACHPCGKRLAGGHDAAWMDPASAGFHASAANRDLAACQACHGPALDGVGGTTVVSCAACHGATWRTSCTLCHGGTDDATGAPPRATWANAADAVRVGTHRSHLAATHGLSTPVACSACHVVPTDALSPGHVDGPTATLAFSGLAVKGLAAAPAWDRAQATCAGTYCHGATLGGGSAKAPVWTATGGAARACDACHGAPPPPPHPGNADCGACHDGYGPAAVNAATHLDGTVQVSGAGVTCRTCHGSDANPAPPVGTHGETLTTELAVGAHQVHLAGGVLSGPIACAECHVVPTAMDHADGQPAVTFGALARTGGATPEWRHGDATCASTYCHGQFVGGNLLAAPTWTLVGGGQAACGTCHGLPPPPPHLQNPACGSCHPDYTGDAVNLALHVNGIVDVRSDIGCTSCHGSGTDPAPPTGTRGEVATSTRAVGAHQAHLDGGGLRAGLACTECHVVPTAIDHANGLVDLAFGPLARAEGAPASFDAAALTCTNYCHGATLRGGGTNLTPLWTGGPSQVACGSCHGTPPPAPHVYTTVCDNCHPGYTMTSVNPATHIDGIIQSENLTCSSCHGDDSRVLAMAADPLAIAAPPYGTRGETDPSTRAVGQHIAHVNRGNGLALPNTCDHCHPVPTSTDHANGTAEVRFAGLATMDGAAPTFDGQTCANTYCHGATLNRGGTDHSPTWTNPAAVTCGSCHGVPPPLPHPQDSDCIRCHPGYTATSVRKATHVNGISDFPTGCNSCHDIPPSSGEHYEHLQHRIACDRCHAGYTTTSANPTLHRNAVQDVTLSGWNAKYRTCSNIGCHGSEYWGRGGTAARLSCNQCHGVPPSSGEHWQHSEYSCSRCHGTGYSTTTVNTATHMSGTVDVPFSFYDRATLTCSRACHGSERWGSRSPVAPNCGNCHGFPPALPHPQQNACQDCHPSMLSTGVLTSTHNDGSLDISGSGCAACHGFPPTSTRAGGIHPADANCYGCHSTTVGPDNTVLPNGTHNDGAVQLGGGGVGTYGCQTCHGDQARSAPVNADPNVKAAPPVGTRGETEATTRAVGAHLAHVSPSAGTLAGPARCNECHVVPTAMDHANGTVLLTFGGRAVQGGAQPVYDGAALTCAATYCHGATLNAGGTSHTPTWTGGSPEAACGTCHAAPPPAPHPDGASCGGCHDGYTATTVNLALHVDGKVDVSAAACNGCHGSAPNAAPPTGLHGETLTTQRAVGAHQVHLAGSAIGKPTPCEECHIVPTAMYHSNHTVELAWGPLARSGGAVPSWDGTALTCANYCHGATLTAAGGTNKAPVWTGGASQAACGTCHGAPPPAPHVQNANCGGCHTGYTATTVNLATHVDGQVQFTAMTCTSCHGQAGQAATAASPLAAAPPVDASGAATGIRVGAHQKHLLGGTYANAFACKTCHASVGTYTTAHSNGTRDVGFTGAANANLGKGTWRPGTGTAAGTCASTWCHGAVISKSGGTSGGTAVTPSWTGAITTCTACHAVSMTSLPGRHSTHSGRASCADCHTTGYSTSAVNKALHVNGTRDVGNKVRSWNGSTCTSTCHGSESW